MRLGRCLGGCPTVCVAGAPGARPGLAGNASWGVPSGGPGGGAEEGAAMEDGGFARQAACLWNEASPAMSAAEERRLSRSLLRAEVFGGHGPNAGAGASWLGQEARKV